MQRTGLLLFLVLPACLAVPEPAPDGAADLATPPAPSALSAASGAMPPDGATGLLPVPIATESAGEVLGRVIVSPGNPGEPGLWLRTSRTGRMAQGQVVTADGAAVDVVLIPAAGVSQLSAEGYAALGLPAGSFAEVTIFLR